MKSKQNALNANTIVFGFFENVEILFVVGDCQRIMDCVKVHNLRKIDEEHVKEVPSTLCVSDTRLTLTSHTKTQICAYFNAVPSPALKVQIIKKVEKKETRKVHAARY